MARALVLGAYGLIGSACARALVDAGFDVTGVGRSSQAAQRSNLSVDWVIRDIAQLTIVEWQDLLAGCDVVVNAAGALQDGARDRLEAIHVTALKALTRAAETMPLRVVQVSAAGVAEDASTEFFRSKARGDAVIARGLSDWVILRPTLVLAPEAYGGTALLRAAAAIPLVQPKVLPDAMIQTVSIEDVASVVVKAARKEIAPATILDLTEEGTQSLATLTETMRDWLGVSPPIFRPTLPDWALRAMSSFADLLGQLGWRSPLRRSAVQVLRDGVRGDPSNWVATGGSRCMSLQETLSRMPATRQDRVFARVYLALPFAIATLSFFWVISGLIPFFDLSGTISILTDRGAPYWLSALAVIGGAVLDVALGIAILWRRWAARAAMGMIALSAAYVLGSLMTAPDLWLDPLGPMVKVLPGMMLAGFVALVLEDR